jgi:hypothetical protein
MNGKHRASSTILCFEPCQSAQWIERYVQETTHDGRVHPIIEYSGTFHFLTGSDRERAARRQLVHCSRARYELESSARVPPLTAACSRLFYP